LAKEAMTLKMQSDDILQREKNLYEIHKFLVRPFIIVERDYVKFVRQELTTLRALFIEYNIVLD
jgi:hypothetical protein